MSRWSALPLVCLIAGCNWLIGLDNVNIESSGSGGAAGTTGTQQGGGGDTTSSGAAGSGGTGGRTETSHGGDGGTTGTHTGGDGGTHTGGDGGTTGTQTGGDGGTTLSSGGGGGHGGTGGSGPDCVTDADCSAPLVCDTPAGACVAPTCDDSKKDGTETAQDCGGPMCPACADGLTCGAGTDCVSGVCAGTCQPPKCGDGVVNGADVCDDGNTNSGDGCSAACTVEMGYTCSGTKPSVCGVTCGDGLVLGGEQCDDGNATNGDGCTTSCQIEQYYQCRREAPPTCTKQETRCLDAQDNEGDGAADGQDADCVLPVYYPQLGCSSVMIYRSVNVPMDIPDDSNNGARSVIVVPDDIGVAHMSVVLDVTHPRDSDVVATLFMPFGQPRTLTNAAGGNGANYQDTVFDSTCAVNTSMGVPPFAACHKPQSFLPNQGQGAKGTWTLEVEDKAPGQTGTLDGWTLVICAQ